MSKVSVRRRLKSQWCERVLDLVRKTRRQLADGGQAVGATQPIFQLPDVAEIPKHADDTKLLAFAPAQGRHTELHRQPATIAPTQRERHAWGRHATRQRLQQQLGHSGVARISGRAPALPRREPVDLGGGIRAPRASMSWSRCALARPGFCPYSFQIGDLPCSDEAALGPPRRTLTADAPPWVEGRCQRRSRPWPAHRGSAATRDGHGGFRVAAPARDPSRTAARPMAPRQGQHQEPELQRVPSIGLASAFDRTTRTVPHFGRQTPETANLGCACGPSGCCSGSTRHRARSRRLKGSRPRAGLPLARTLPSHRARRVETSPRPPPGHALLEAEYLYRITARTHAARLRAMTSPRRSFPEMATRCVVDMKSSPAMTWSHRTVAARVSRRSRATRSHLPSEPHLANVCTRRARSPRLRTWLDRLSYEYCRREGSGQRPVGAPHA